MDPIQFFATLILITTLITLAVAVAAYAAYKLRERRRPVTDRVHDDEGEHEAIFLEPYRPARRAVSARFGD